jgi:hypothetical protein
LTVRLRRQIVAAAAGFTVLAGASSASAIPAFARRYGVACDYCHQGYPKLNPMGQRFKERGLRMAQEDPFVVSEWLRGVPLSLRASGAQAFVERIDDQTSGVAKAISAGSLGRRLSYWADYLLTAQEGDDTFDGRVDNAWAQVEVVHGGRLYAKGGRFELDLPFTAARSPHLFPYEVYNENPGFEYDAIGRAQDGVELGGGLPGDVRWSAAVVAGRDRPGAESLSSETARFDANLFARVAKRVGQHRLGAFAYFGRNTLALSPGIVWDDDLLRVGGDVSFWFDRLNLYGLVMYGRNDNPVATPTQPRGTFEEATFTGGFLQADFHWTDQIIATLRGEVIDHGSWPARPRGETTSAIYPGLQLFVRERFKLSFEYAFRGDRRLDGGILQAEVAF